MTIPLWELLVASKPLRKYMSQGGFPELFEVKNKKAYIRNLSGNEITSENKKDYQ